MSAISKQQRVKGQIFLDEAAKVLAKRTWLASSSEQKFEDAAEQYQRAGNAFKIGGFHNDAGDAYRKAAKIYTEHLRNLMEASKCLKDAGHCYKKDNSQAAVEAFNSAITLLCDASRLTQAAKLSKEVAEIFENGDTEVEDTVIMAIESYEQAAELFEMEQQRSQSSQCLVKVAELCSAAKDPPNFERAIDIYDKLGKGCLESNLLKFNAKIYFIKCSICHLANGDSVGAAGAMQRYNSLDYTLEQSREGKFVDSLIKSVENMDPESFATSCFEYDKITKLDPYLTSLLLRVRNTIEGEDGVVGEDDEVDLT